MKPVLEALAIVEIAAIVGLGLVPRKAAAGNDHPHMFGSLLIMACFAFGYGARQGSGTVNDPGFALLVGIALPVFLAAAAWGAASGTASARLRLVRPVGTVFVAAQAVAAGWVWS
ncbi:hypothetical protein ABZY09_37845 [Streptomyces sp. NPDC002928]|uniref:hypothetical protein n=1 Tax=Streptomyces sp. NPDC002928 TaxID=3154440 RepID=UPI0033AC433C